MGIKKGKKMSGSSIAYHLRQNKTIDRNMFIDLLNRVGRVKNISDYEYIGFGGPFLEDFKALHAALRIKKMQSIEGDENTFNRQNFNLPFKFIKPHNKNSADFFRDHQFSKTGTIVWLDYTSTRELRQQFDEFRTVVSSANYFDVVRITLNANPANIPGKKEKGESIQEARLKTIKSTIDDYIPPDLSEDNLVFKEYPNFLQKCLHRVVADLSAGETNRYFQILASFVYQDGQQMLTVTGVVLDASKDPAKIRFLKRSRISHWPFANLDWAPPTPISVPSLSVKERIRLDECLPINKSDDEVIAALTAELGYVPGDLDDAKELANYARYYRAYPHYSRVVL